MWESVIREAPTGRTARSADRRKPAQAGTQRDAGVGEHSPRKLALPARSEPQASEVPDLPFAHPRSRIPSPPGPLVRLKHPVRRIAAPEGDDSECLTGSNRSP
jgi:hypothetical protein